MSCGSSRGSSRRSSSNTPPRAGSSSATSSLPRVRVPWQVTRLVVPLVVDYSASHKLAVDYFDYAAHPVASARHAARRRLLRLAQARRRLLRLRRASGCLGTSCGLSRGSSSTTPPRAGSPSTTSPMPCDRVPRHVARLVVDYSASRRLVVDYFVSVARPGTLARCAARHATHRAARRRLLRLRRASGCLGTSRGLSLTTPPRAGSSSTTSPTPRDQVPRHVARLLFDYPASRRLVVNYFASSAHLGALARRAARHVARRVARRRLLRLAQACRQLLRLHRATGCLGTSRGSSRHRRRLLRLTQARRRLLLLRRASGCLGTSRGSSCGSPLVVDYSASHRLLVDYFASAARPGASARRVARHVARRAARRRLLRLAQARRRLLRLRCASGCLSTSHGSSHGSSRR
jgi:hypothetical protein